MPEQQLTTTSVTVRATGTRPSDELFRLMERTRGEFSRISGLTPSRDRPVMENTYISPTSLERMPDDMLLASLGTGDQQAALTFIWRFQPVVFGVALTIVGDSGLAEDIAQQAFERAWRHAGLYDPRQGSVRTWLTRIVHNLAVDAVRVRLPAPVDPHDLQPLIAAITDTPERQVLAEETSAQLRTALATLPPEQARAVVMAAVHAMTAREIAGAENIPIGTAKSRIRAAMIKLHAALSYERVNHD